jgi:hypothetical protein
MKTGPPIASSAAASALNATVNPPGHTTRFSEPAAAAPCRYRDFSL